MDRVFSNTKVKFQFLHLWTFPESRIRGKENSVNDFIQSDVYHVTNLSNVKYFFELYPFGWGLKNREKAEIFLYLDPGIHQQIEVKYKIIMPNNLVIKCNNVFDKFEKKSAINHQKPLQLFGPDQKMAFVNGEFAIKIEGTLKVKKESQNQMLDKNGNGGMFVQLMELKDKDFAILVDGKEIKVHRKILIENSRRFEAFFSAVSKDQKFDELAIPNYSYHIIETAIKFLSDRNLVISLSMNDLMKLLQFYNEYFFDLLKQDLEHFMSNLISFGTVSALSECAEKCNAKLLKEKCVNFYH